MRQYDWSKLASHICVNDEIIWHDLTGNKLLFRHRDGNGLPTFKIKEKTEELINIVKSLDINYDIITNHKSYDLISIEAEDIYNSIKSIEREDKINLILNQ